MRRSVDRYAYQESDGPEQNNFRLISAPNDDDYLFTYSTKYLYTTNSQSQLFCSDYLIRNSPYII